MKWRGRGLTREAELEWRRLAVVKSRDRYLGKVFAWETGVTCLHMLRFHMRNMGHRPPGIPRFRSALGAKRAMQQRGWGSVSEMLDSMLPRIAPAQMWLGDVLITEGTDGLDAININAGLGRVLGWHETAPGATFVGIDLNDALGAWRL